MGVRTDGGKMGVRTNFFVKPAGKTYGGRHLSLFYFIK